MKNSLYILGQLSDSDIEWMISVGKREKMPLGTVLIQQGKKTEKLFIVLEGKFSVLVGSHQVAQLGVGEIIGEMSFVDSRPPSATVKSSENAVVFSILRSQITQNLQNHPEMGLRFYRALAVFLADRLRTTTNNLGGKRGEMIDESAEQEDELDFEVLDNVHLAGARFEKILKKMSLAPFC